jgi:hypothetical protein
MWIIVYLQVCFSLYECHNVTDKLGPYKSQFDCEQRISWIANDFSRIRGLKGLFLGLCLPYGEEV